MSEELKALIANMAAVIRVQNGNRYEDINKLLSHADEVLLRPAPAVQVPEGWAVVEPLLSMAYAAGMYGEDFNMLDARAMLAAAATAPSAPAVQVPENTVAYWRSRAAEHAASDNPEYQEYAAGITDALNALAAPTVATEDGAQGGGVDASMFRSKLFQMFLEQGFWHASHVDLVWRHNGQDVREEADWLKEVWYSLRTATTEVKQGGGVDAETRGALLAFADRIEQADEKQPIYCSKEAADAIRSLLTAAPAIAKQGE